MTEIISVRFKSGGRQYYFDPAGLTVDPKIGVIVETSRGLEFGECVQGNREVEDSEVVLPLRPVIRIATEHDLEVIEKSKEREEQAFAVCQEKIIEHQLDMKLVSVEQNFEGNKLLFFFTAENRVDFRTLVKDLAATFRTRIELRQIGVRDEAKLLGGLGICGKPFCCSSFLGEFQPVSIKMAKTQNLSLNPTKISGTCGRLMCCLKYEQDAYEDAVRRCPRLESFVETPDGVGTVTSVNLLREQVKVHLEESDDSPNPYPNDEINVVRNGKGKRPEGYVSPSKADLAKLRRITEDDSSKQSPQSSSLNSMFMNLPSFGAKRAEGFSGSGKKTGDDQKHEVQKSDSRRGRHDNRGGSSEGRGRKTGNKNNSYEDRADQNQEDMSDSASFRAESKIRPPEPHKMKNGGKRPQDRKNSERKQPSPAGTPNQEDKKPKQKFRRPYRGKPKNGGSGNNGTSGNNANSEG
jgi:cell fate regulator YaaT (PSP1 superfamily)